MNPNNNNVILLMWVPQMGSFGNAHTPWMQLVWPCQILMGSGAIESQPCAAKLEVRARGVGAQFWKGYKGIYKYIYIYLYIDIWTWH